MSYAIQIKFLPATATKRTRIKANWGRISITIPFNYSHNVPRNALIAAIELRKRYSPSLKFNGMGLLPSGHWVITTK